MTNTPSGSKRTWDESYDVEQHRRKRTRDKEDAKDWRDVYLNEDRKKPSSSRRDRDGRYRHEKDHRPSHKSERRSPTSLDYGRDDRDSHPTYSPRDRDTRGRGREPQKPSSPDSEKEEGEISPRYSSADASIPSRTQSPPVNRTAQPGPQKEPEQEMELDIPTTPPPVEETLAARRAKRLAILAKYSNQPTPAHSNVGTPLSGTSSAVPPPPSTVSVSDNLSRINRAEPPTPLSPATPAFDFKRESVSASPEPNDFTLAKGGDEQTQDSTPAQNEGGEHVSAADYDPNQDRREDEGKRVHDNGHPGDEVEMIVEEEDEEEDLDDMFAVTTTEKKKLKKIKRVLKPTAPALVTTTLDSASDPEGYYSVILGEQLDGGHYQVFSSLGKGMFANVVRARVIGGESADTGKEVAIKIIRCQESMYKAGLKEVQMLNKLKQADPDDKKHVVRLERTFEHRGHLCLVFESLSMNLRDVVKRFGKDVGINIRAVRVYAKQLFLALSLLKKCNIMHADVKPDNILVNEQKTVLKLCDLGSASDVSENEITPYLVSRFYRAPEIILGAPYDPAIDIWSIGCTLYELYTGKILLPGRSNNHMLLLMMELRGRFNTKMIKKAQFGDVYFDEMGAFISIERDRVTGADVVRHVHTSKPSRDLRTRLMPPASAGLQDEEVKVIASFIDLLDKCLALDPGRRITPRDALNHPFLRG